MAMAAVEVIAMGVFAMDVIAMKGTVKKAVDTLEVCGYAWRVEGRADAAHGGGGRTGGARGDHGRVDWAWPCMVVDVAVFVYC